MDVPERDWRHLRALHDAALDRYCTRVLAECAKIIERDAPAHDRYLELFRLLKKRDADLAAAFDDMRRSRAIQRLAAMINLDLVEDRELAGFTVETREAASGLADIWRPRGKRRT